MDTFIQDIRYAFAHAAPRARGVALAVLCLALGIGANATMFSVVHSTLVQPLPFAEPDRLVDAWTLDAPRSGGRSSGLVHDFRRLERQARSFEALAGVGMQSLTLSGGARSGAGAGAAVSAGLFTMLGRADGARSRHRADRRRPGAGPVVVLTDGLWRAATRPIPPSSARPSSSTTGRMSSSASCRRRWSSRSGRRRTSRWRHNRTSAPAARSRSAGVRRLAAGCDDRAGARRIGRRRGSARAAIPRTRAGARTCGRCATISRPTK